MYYLDLWVATDGIVTVRFPDRASARTYCEEAGWDEGDLILVRTPVSLSEDVPGEVLVHPWMEEMDPEISDGAWAEDTGAFLPPFIPGLYPLDILDWRKQDKENLGKVFKRPDKVEISYRDAAARIVNSDE